MPNSPNNTHALFSSRVKIPATQYIGEAGRIFYHEATGELRLSDGVTPGGLQIFAGGGGGTWGSIVGTLSNQIDLKVALDTKADISGQVFTGNISAPNLSGTNTGDQTFDSISPITTEGDLIIGVGANTAGVLSIGANSYVLTSDGTTANWSPATGGGGGSTLLLYVEQGTPTTVPSATAQGSIALGDGALASQRGSVVQSSGIFSQSGDAQSGSYVARGITVDGTQRDLYLDGAGISLAIPANTSIAFLITVMARRIDTGPKGAMYEFRGGVDNYSSPRIIGTVSRTIVATDNPAWGVQIGVDTTSLLIQVTGEIGATINWVAHINTVEVSI